MLSTCLPDSLILLIFINPCKWPEIIAVLFLDSSLSDQYPFPFGVMNRSSYSSALLLLDLSSTLSSDSFLARLDRDKLLDRISDSSVFSVMIFSAAETRSIVSLQPSSTLLILKASLSLMFSLVLSLPIYPNRSAILLFCASICLQWASQDSFRLFEEYFGCSLNAALSSLSPFTCISSFILSALSIWFSCSSPLPPRSSST